MESNPFIGSVYISQTDQLIAKYFPALTAQFKNQQLNPDRNQHVKIIHILRYGAVADITLLMEKFIIDKFDTKNHKSIVMQYVRKRDQFLNRVTSSPVSSGYGNPFDDISSSSSASPGTSPTTKLPKGFGNPFIERSRSPSPQRFSSPTGLPQGFGNPFDSDEDSAHGASDGTPPTADGYGNPFDDDSSLSVTSLNPFDGSSPINFPPRNTAIREMLLKNEKPSDYTPSNVRQKLDKLPKLPTLSPYLMETYGGGQASLQPNRYSELIKIYFPELICRESKNLFIQPVTLKKPNRFADRYTHDRQHGIYGSRSDYVENKLVKNLISILTTTKDIVEGFNGALALLQPFTQNFPQYVPMLNINTGETEQLCPQQVSKDNHIKNDVVFRMLTRINNKRDLSHARLDIKLEFVLSQYFVAKKNLDKADEVFTSIKDLQLPNFQDTYGLT